MPYNIHKFKSYDKLTAIALNEMDNGIAENYNEIENLKEQITGHNVDTSAHADIRAEVSNIKAGILQQTPLFANSITECTDITKVYVLPDGYIYAYMCTDTGYQWQSTGHAFVPSDYDDRFVDLENKKFDKSSVVHTLGNSETEVLSQKAVTECITALDKGLSATETEVLRNSKRISNLEKGLPDESFLTDSEVSYAKTVPQNALPYAEVGAVGGMTRKCSNLWNPEKTTFSGIKTTKNADGSVTVETNNVSMGATIVLTQKLPSGQYTFTNLDGTTIYIMRSGSDYTTGVTIGSSKTFEYDGESFLRLMASDQQANTIRTYKWMLNSGEKALPYEPYFEGLRSAPVTEVESLGANLIPFPYTESSKEKNGISYTVNADGSVRAKGTATLTDNFILRGDGSLLDLGVKDGETVSVSGEFGFAVYDVTENKGYTNTSFVVNANHVYRIRINFAKGSTIDTTFYPMLNKGSTALPYTPYQRNTLAIPDEVKALDGYGWGVNGEVYNYVDWEKKQFVKRVEKSVLTGTESFRIQVNNDDGLTKMYQFAMNIELATSKDGYYPSLCSHYEEDYSIYSGTKPCFAIYKVNKSYSYIRIRDYFDTDEELKSYLAEQYSNGNPITIFYELSEPVITDISDILPDDNYIGVEGGGTVTMLNEYGYAVQSEITYMLKGGENV